MEPDSGEEAETAAMASLLLPLASAAQQPYVSELLSFTLDRLHKVRRLEDSPARFAPNAIVFIAL